MVRFFCYKKLLMDNPQSPNNSPDWERKTLEKLVFSTLEEQKTRRRWGIFFRFLGFAYLAVVLVAVVVALVSLLGPLGAGGIWDPHELAVAELARRLELWEELAHLLHRRALYIAWDGKAENYTRLPKKEELKRTPAAAYVHVTTNETIQGVEYHGMPAYGMAPCGVSVISM